MDILSVTMLIIEPTKWSAHGEQPVRGGTSTSYTLQLPKANILKVTNYISSAGIFLRHRDLWIFFSFTGIIVFIINNLIIFIILKN